MNVVLVNPPIRLPFAFAHYPMFSTLGMLTNAAWLRHKGHTVRVVDAFTLHERLNISPDGEDFRHIGAEVPDVIDAVRATVGELSGETALVVTITMFSEMNRPQENHVPTVANALREAFPDAPIGLADLHIAGMNYFPYDPVAVLDAVPGADWALIGEGEPTLPTILDRLVAGEALDGLPRFAYRAEGGVRWDPTPPNPVANLDDEPFPAFDLIDMDHYFSAQADALQNELVHEYHLVERQIPLMTSRGCPYRCSFCTNQVLALPWRSHSVDYLRRLMTELRERYEVDRFLFLDDNINVKLDRFRELVAWLAEAKVPWDAVNGYRADHLDRETVQLIKAAGNTKITVSAESGDPELLNTVIHKGLKLSSVIDLAKICEEERVPLQVHYIVGVPGETKTQINKTLEFSTRLFEIHGAWPLLQHAIPFPGTQLYRDCEEKDYFIAPPDEIPGDVLEVESIIRTPDFDPTEVIRMKLNAQHMHRSVQQLTFLDVEPRCSHHCLACHCVPRGEGAPPEAPSLVDLHAQLDRALFLGARELFLGGGEPTLRPDLPVIIAKAREMGFERVSLVTNAAGLASPRRARRIFAAGVDRLVVDIHGPGAAVHDAVTRTPGSFVRALQGIAEAVKAGVKELDAAIAITKVNLEKLPATVHFVVGLGFRSVHLQLPGPDSPAAREGAVPRWETARPWLLRAVAVGRKLGADVSIQGAPLCLLPDFPGVLTPLPPWALQRSRSHRVKHPVCRECTEYILCGGFFRPEHEPTYGVMADRGLVEPPPDTPESVPAAESVPVDGEGE